MLSGVPGAMNRMTRNVVINHPNTWECQVFRKRLTRAGATPGSGDVPPLGGLGVLTAEDETDIAYDHLGNGYALPAEVFGPSLMTERGDTANYGAAAEARFLIEPAEPSGMPGYFDVHSGDVIYLVLADGVKLAFEVVNVEATVNIPPFVTRYVRNRRGDLDLP